MSVPEEARAASRRQALSGRLASRLLGFDPFDPGFLRDPCAHYRELRDRGPLIRTPGGIWVATTYDACAGILRDPRFGRGGDPLRLRRKSTRPAMRNLLLMDPPEHTRLRGTVTGAFTPRVIALMESRIRETAGRLVAGMLDADGEIDAISALAYPLPLLTIVELLGLPYDDIPRFTAWSESLTRGLDPDVLLPDSAADRRERAAAEFREYFGELVISRREHPGDDLLSGLAGERNLSMEEVLGTCVLLLVAGHETTAGLIGSAIRLLAGHDGGFRALRDDPGAAAGVVEEVLRYDPPVQFVTRAVLDDVEVCGHPLRRGERVLVLLASANRDPAVFPDPDTFDPARPPGRHLTFGLGVHFCLGASLARLEGQAALLTLAEKAPGIRTTGEPVYKENLALRRLSTLPVRLDQPLRPQDGRPRSVGDASP